MLDGSFTPNRKEKHNAKVRARILSAASGIFREKGYDGAGIDALMAEAGLTRGAFYAHFLSKEALFIEVLSMDDPLLSQLKARKGKEDITLWREMARIVSSLLDPEAKRSTASSVSLVAFSHEAARGSDAAKLAYNDLYEATLTEMTRGLPVEPSDNSLTGMLNVLVGSLTLAAAAPKTAQRRMILEAGTDQVAMFARRLKRSILAERVAVTDKAG